MISGPGTLTMSGYMLTLSGGNTYAGATTISAGTLTIADPGQLGGGTYAANITNNGALVFSTSVAHTLPGIISGSGSLAKSGTGTLTLSGANTYTGGTSVTAGSGLVTVQNNQSAANGGWVVGGATGAGAATTVSFDSGSAIAVASGSQLVIGSTTGGGTSGQTLNVAGTVNNQDLLNVTRVGTINLNSGASWSQAGDLSLTGVGGYSATLNVNSGSSLAYSGINTIKLNGTDANHGLALLNIDGTGSFTTGMGFEQTTTPDTGGYGLLKLSNGGTLKLSAAVAAITTQVQCQLDTGGGVIDNNGFNAALSGQVTVGATRNGIFGAGSLTKKGAAPSPSPARTLTPATPSSARARWLWRRPIPSPPARTSSSPAGRRWMFPPPGFRCAAAKHWATALAPQI